MVLAETLITPVQAVHDVIAHLFWEVESLKKQGYDYQIIAVTEYCSYALLSSDYYGNMNNFVVDMVKV